METQYHSGFVTLVGRSNVGKSTLINALVGEKVSIVSDKPQTTRNQIRGVLTREDYQIVFVDTPGQHIPRTKLGEYMVQAARSAAEEVDSIVMVLDGSVPIGGGDRTVLESLRGNPSHVLCVINKIDLIPRPKLLEIIDRLREYTFLEEILPVSARTGDGLEELERLLAQRLPEGPQYFPEDMYTDQSQRAIMAEMIREKALYLLREEVPHGIAVEMARIEPHKGDPDMMDVYADIYVEKESHKGIVIGKRGATLQKLGSMARKDIEEMMGCAINLQLFVKVREGWRDRPTNLRDLGYDSREL